MKGFAVRIRYCNVNDRNITSKSEKRGGKFYEFQTREEECHDGISVEWEMVNKGVNGERTGNVDVGKGNHTGSLSHLLHDFWG